MLLDARCPCPAVVDCCPDFFIHIFLACAVASFAVSSATWLDSSKIVFASSATDVLSACVAVTRFASARVCSCCISVSSSAFACAACTCATYPSVLEVLEDLLISLKDRAKWALNLPMSCHFVACATNHVNCLDKGDICQCWHRPLKQSEPENMDSARLRLLDSTQFV